jgi:hypothetical protein
LALRPSPLPAQEVGADMAHAANSFLASLTAEQKAKATFEWKDEDRLNWHFIPKDRPGLALKDLTPPQKQLTQALMASALSPQGHVKAASIMSLESILQELEGPNRRFPRNPELYHISLFGQPGPQSTWGWRLEGHHLSLNYTIVKGELIAGTPSFMGTNPAEVKAGPRRGLRVLAAEEDLARALVQSFSDDQKSKAIVEAKAPSDILTGANRKVSPLDQVGLPVSQMNEEQTAALRNLIRAYVFRNRAEMARLDLAKIREAGFRNIYFAWMGGIEKGQGHYYRVQGPTFLLEYDCTQNDANHIHAVWRDFENDFGLDLLKKHYEEAHR